MLETQSSDCCPILRSISKSGFLMRLLNCPEFIAPWLFPARPRGVARKELALAQCRIPRFDELIVIDRLARMVGAPFGIDRRRTKFRRRRRQMATLADQQDLMLIAGVVTHANV